MPEDFGELGQRALAVDHLAGNRVVEPVSGDSRAASPEAGPPHDAGDPCCAEGSDRTNSSRGHLPVLGDPRTAPLQLGSNRLANVARRPEAVLVSALAAHHDLTTLPFEVLET